MTWDDQSCHSGIIPRHEIDLTVTWNDVIVMWHDAELASEGLVDGALSGKDAGMTCMIQKETVKGGSHFLRFLSGTKLLHFGAFKRRFEPPERPVLLPTPGNSHTPYPMRSVAFVASSDYVMIGVDSMASDQFFGDRDAFDAATLVALAPADAPQIEVPDGVEHAPTHQGAVPLRVRGYGKYSGSDRTIARSNS